MSEIFEKAWYDQFKRNKRDRPEMGTVSLDGVTAYPLEDRAGNLNLDRMTNFRVGRPHNIEAFRNIDSTSLHLNPGRIKSTGEIRPNTGALSVMRGQKPIAISNVLPINNPFFRLDEKAQRSAFLGNPDRDRKANRTAHMWTAGDLSAEELNAMMGGEQTPQQILGMTDDLVLDRNDFGDSMLSWKYGDDLYEAPRFAYEVYDLEDKSLPHNKKWKMENRKYRDDFALPFRSARGHRVSGSVDPLLRIPLHFAGQQAPELARQSKGGQYVEWVHPETGYRYEGVPVPLSLTGDYDQPAVSRGISTGTHGLYFDPRDLTGAGREVWDSALSGDVIRRALESIQIRDEMSLEKMPTPALRGYKEGNPLKTVLPIQGVKNAPMYGHIMNAIRDVLGERDTYENFAGMGGLSHQYQAKRAILNDINPDLGRLNRGMIAKPMKVDVTAQNLKEGDPILFPHDELGMMNLGEITPELATLFGEGNETFLPAHYYKLRHDFNKLREKERLGMATNQDIDDLNSKFYILQQMGMNGLVRYSPSNALPSLDIPYSVSPGARGLKTPVHQPIEDAFFNQLTDAGLASYNDEGEYKYTGRSPSAGSYRLMKPGGNLARPQRMKGQGGIHDLTRWHEAMKDWEYRTGSAFDFYNDVKDEMNPETSQFLVDSPYFGEQGAHNHFLEPEQKLLIEQLIDAKNRGIPTTVFNSMHPSIVKPLEEAGFHIEPLQRLERSTPVAGDRVKVGEMMAMANIDQDAFQTAWERRKNPPPAQRTLF
tara:strand:+ start:11211 stop:13505 length:2295 start_codon:yes stop_codon:yes gene_type:complete